MVIYFFSPDVKKKGRNEMSENQCIGFIGSGNMGTALMKGLIQSSLFSEDQLFAYDKDEKALKRVFDLFGLNCCKSNSELTRKCSIILFCVKPQNMRDVLQEVKDEINENHLLISIAAGITIEMICSMVGERIPVIRVMPNTPALIQKGISALSSAKNVSLEHMRLAAKIFGAVGDTVEVEESMMDAVTALSGSGPGYVFRIMESMVEEGIGLGLNRDTSERLVIQTFLGAASLAKDSDFTLAGLRKMVTSRGGTTAAGLDMFDQMGLDVMIHKAIEAAYRRSVKLGEK
mgnify:CR=1 FL=1